MELMIGCLKVKIFSLAILPSDKIHQV